MKQPTYFANAEEFGDWLEENHSCADELIVGFYKTSRSSSRMSWSESVDQALCYGWIDGVRKRIDEERYQIRFTPRKAKSVWSTRNLNRFQELKVAGKTKEGGEAAFSERSEARSGVYSYEQDKEPELKVEEIEELKGNPEAWEFFQKLSPSYKQKIVHWIHSAKMPSTRKSRFTQLFGACSGGRRL